MSYHANSKAEIRESLKLDLARELGCQVSEIPTGVGLGPAGRYLGVKNKNTFHVWKNSKRYPLVWLKRGKVLEIGSASLIELRLNQAEFPAEAS